MKPSDAPTPAATVRPVVAALLILGAVLLAWSNSLSGPFVFDDLPSIAGNASIHRLLPPDWLHPPATAGETVSGRPVLNLTFALDYAAAGLDVRCYHWANLWIHAAAGILLWAILRRTPGLGGPRGALAAALLWSVHPLQTAAVTYTVQRAESLAGFFALLTLYAFIRGASSPCRLRWFGLAVASCLLSVGTKETVVVVPVLVLLYDRTFLARSFRAAWQARGGVHAALFATWLPLALLVVANHARGGSAGTGTIDAGTYFLTQGGAIVRYLGLALWPANLVFDYGTPVVASFAAVWPQFLLLAMLAATTVVLLVRNRAAGFAGACFFLLLAPSSSFVPVGTQTMAEHRCYLALAVPIALAVAALGSRLKPAVGVGLSVVLVLALGGATFRRNADYHSALSLWGDTVAKRPDNPRAHYNLGLALAQAGRGEEATAEFGRTLELQPNHAFAHFELGKAALLTERWSEAAVNFEAALQADPHYADARVNYAQALVGLGRPADAIAQYEAALADDAGAPDIRTNLAGLLVRQGRVGEGTTILREVVAADPGLAEAHYHLGLALTKSGAAADAEAEFRTAVQLKPTFGAAQRALGNAQTARGDTVAAEASYREALRLDERSAESWFALGGLLARHERLAEAASAFEAALARDPTHVLARANLANCQLMTGRLDAAIANYEAVLRVRPGDAGVQRNLEMARAMKRNGQ